MKKLVFVLCFSALTAIVIFYSIMNWYLINYDPFTRWVINQTKIIDSSKKIFILGSSQVASLNSTYIENHLTYNETKYAVYDLAIGGDSPSLRLGDIDTIISLKPSIIVYGVGIRDFEKKALLNISPLGTNQDLSQNLLPTVNLIDEKTSLVLKENQFLNKIFGSPKFITLKLFNYAIRHDFGYNYPDITLKTPLIQSDITPTVSNSRIKEKFDRTPTVFRGIDIQENNQEYVAFTKILQKFTNNGIKVIVFTVPNNRIILNTIPNSDVQFFTDALSKIVEENNSNVYFLHDKYADLEVWGDLHHVAYNNTTMIYSKDIIQIIQQELNS